MPNVWTIVQDLDQATQERLADVAMRRAGGCGQDVSSGTLPTLASSRGSHDWGYDVPMRHNNPAL
jgi:hypothetical protein